MAIYLLIDGERVKVPDEVKAEGPEAVEAFAATLTETTDEIPDPNPEE